MKVALETLSLWLLAIFVLFVFTVRPTPPGGLGGFHYFLMCTLPVGAYFAGRKWFNGIVFLVYGTLGMLLFITGFLGNGRLGLGLAFGDESVAGYTIKWTVGSLFVAVVCRVAGWVGHEQALLLPAGKESPGFPVVRVDPPNDEDRQAL